MTAQERLNNWAVLGDRHGQNVVDVTTTREFVNSIPMWEGTARQRPDLGMVITVDAGPRGTVEEVCVLLIERLAQAGVDVP